MRLWPEELSQHRILHVLKALFSKREMLNKSKKKKSSLNEQLVKPSAPRTGTSNKHKHPAARVSPLIYSRFGTQHNQAALSVKSRCSQFII